LAQEVGKPVVLHTRDAFPDLIAILDEFPGLRGVFHCFSGNSAIAAEALSRGYYISFAGTVTYPTAHGVIGAASIIPLDRRLLERIVEALDLQATDAVVEVGPGLGALTVELASRVRAVVGVEIDPTCVKALGLALRDHPNVRILEANILQVPVADFLPAD